MFSNHCCIFWLTDAGTEEEEAAYWSAEWSKWATSVIPLEQEAANRQS